MKSFDIEREKIIEIFGGRPGFTDEVIDAITATYVYFDDKYKELIPIEEIPDAKTFKNVTLPKSSYSIAEIYLNRIYNNVTEVVSDHGPAGPTASQYDERQLKVFVPPNDHYSWDNRLNSHVNIKNASKEERALRRRQIRAKVITHELIHAASFDGLFIGFIATEKFYSSDESKNLQKQFGKGGISYSIFEELLTEELAMDIVGMNRIFKEYSRVVRDGEKAKYLYKNRNPESSNHAVNCAAIYLIAAFPDMLRSKFVNPSEYFIKFNKTEERFGFPEYVIKEYGLAHCMKSWLTEMADDYATKDTKKQRNFACLITELQKSCLRIYMQNLKIETQEDYFNAVKLYTKLNSFAISFYNETTQQYNIEEELAEMLSKLQQTIKLSYAKFTEQQKRELKERHDFECSINLGDEPYAHIISNGLLEDSFNLLMF